MLHVKQAQRRPLLIGQFRYFRLEFVGAGVGVGVGRWPRVVVLCLSDQLEQLSVHLQRLQLLLLLHGPCVGLLVHAAAESLHKTLTKRMQVGK